MEVSPEMLGDFRYQRFVKGSEETFIDTDCFLFTTRQHMIH